MSVVDASAFVDALTRPDPGGHAARVALRTPGPLDVPAIFPAEVTSALRTLLARGTIGATRARAARAYLGEVVLHEYPFRPFADRAWELRHSLTVYDAWYVAVAEALDTDLVTADGRLASARGPRCDVRLVG